MTLNVWDCDHIPGENEMNIEDLVNLHMQHSANIAHHRGFIKLPWYKHWWIHLKIWRARRRDKKSLSNQTNNSTD